MSFSAKQILAGIVIIGALASILGQSLPSAPILATKSLIPPTPPTPTCNPLPPSGTTTILDQSMVHRDDIPYGEFGIKNNLPDSLVLLITDIENTHKYQAIYLAQGDTTQIKILSNQYGLDLLIGNKWCNPESGFIDGSSHHISGGVTIKPKENVYAIISPSETPGLIAIQYRIQTNNPPTPKPAEKIINGTLEIQAGPHGYNTSGSLNGTPINFMIDTGATHLTISSQMAQQSGINSCENPAQFSTANGSVAGCYGKVSELIFGPFRLTDVTVSILPNLTEDALLGMDVLSRFNMVWQGNKVRISTIETQNIPTP